MSALSAVFLSAWLTRAGKPQKHQSISPGTALSGGGERELETGVGCTLVDDVLHGTVLRCVFRGALVGEPHPPGSVWQPAP